MKIPHVKGCLGIHYGNCLCSEYKSECSLQRYCRPVRAYDEVPARLMERSLTEMVNWYKGIGNVDRLIDTRDSIAEAWAKNQKRGKT